MQDAIYANVVTSDGYRFSVDEDGCLWVSAAHVVYGLIRVAEGLRDEGHTSESIVAATIANGVFEIFNEGYAEAVAVNVEVPDDLSSL